MELVQTLTNAFVIGAVGLILSRMIHNMRAELNGVRGELKAEIGALRSELKADIADLRTEFRAEMAELRREVGVLRSDLTQVALAVGVKGRAGSQ